MNDEKNETRNYGWLVTSLIGQGIATWWCAADAVYKGHWVSLAPAGLLVFTFAVGFAGWRKLEGD